MFSNIKWQFNVAIVAALLIILFSAFSWSIIDRITVFLYFPLQAIVWSFFLIATIIGLFCLLKYKKIGITACSPLAISVISFLIVYFVPFTNLWVKADFFLYKKEREEIVKKVYDHELTSNVDYNPSLIALGDSYPLVSMGGNEIIVEQHSGLSYIFFFTFRGILDNYSGFLYVPDGGAASYFPDLDESDSTQIIHFGGNWYYASHH